MANSTFPWTLLCLMFVFPGLAHANTNKPVIVFNQDIEIIPANERSMKAEYKELPNIIQKKLADNRKTLLDRLNLGSDYKVINKPAKVGTFNYVMTCRWFIMIDDLRRLNRKNEETNQIEAAHVYLQFNCELRDADFGVYLDAYRGEYSRKAFQGETLNLNDLVDKAFYRFQMRVLPSGKELKATIEDLTRVVEANLRYMPGQIQPADGKSLGSVLIHSIHGKKSKGRGPWGESGLTTNILTRYRLEAQRGVFLNSNTGNPKTMEFTGPDFYRDIAGAYRVFECPEKDGSLQTETFRIFLIGQNAQSVETLIGTLTKQFQCEEEKEVKNPRPKAKTKTKAKPPEPDCQLRGFVSYSFTANAQSENNHKTMNRTTSLFVRNRSWGTIFLDEGPTHNQREAFIHELLFTRTTERAPAYHGCRVGNRIFGRYTNRLTTTLATNSLSRPISDAVGRITRNPVSRCIEVSTSVHSIEGGEMFIEKRIDDAGCNKDDSRVNKVHGPWRNSPRSTTIRIHCDQPKPKPGEILQGEVTPAPDIRVAYFFICEIVPPSTTP